MDIRSYIEKVKERSTQLLGQTPKGWQKLPKSKKISELLDSYLSFLGTEFVGLDIGSNSIKAALIKKGFKEPTLVKVFQIEVGETHALSLERIISAFTERGFPKENVAVSFPKKALSVRVINFPFSDPRKIDQVYAFELENLSPFDLESTVHGYQVLESEGEGCEVIVCVWNREDFKNWLEVIRSKEKELDPQVITFAPLAYGALNEFLPSERPVVLIDIGASTMGFSLFDEGGIRRVRSFWKGGEFITLNLSQELKISGEEAERLKKEGFSGGASGLLSKAFAPILDEIKRTVQAYELELGRRLEKILLSGGTSLMPGIASHISSRLGIDVERLYIPPLGEEGSSVFAEAFSLALFGSSMNRGWLNLRKGEFVYRGELQEVRRALKMPALLLALIVVISLCRSGADYFELKSRARMLETEIHTTLQKNFPGVKMVPTPAARRVILWVVPLVKVGFCLLSFLR